MSKPRFYSDIDNCVLPLVEEILYRYNNTYNDSLVIDDIKSYQIAQYIKPECKSLWSEFCTQDLFENAKPYEGSIEALTYINEITDFKFATAGFLNTMEWRDKWLSKYYPFYTSSQLVRAEDKPRILDGEFILDDCLDNLVGGQCFGIAFDSPWNRHVKDSELGIKRINDWGYGSQAVLIDLIERKQEGMRSA